MMILFLTTLVLATVLVWLGSRTAAAGRCGPLLAATAILAAMPALLNLAYYLHVLDSLAWFYRLRAFPFSELLAAGAGWPVGLLVGQLGHGRIPLRAPLLACLVLLLSVPYLKPLIQPLDRSVLAEKRDHGVCLQSTASTCGPASAVSVLRQLGIEATEAGLSQECHTTATGTECWYLVRALRQLGCQVVIRTDATVDDIRPPAIAGVRLGGSGHFIALLEQRPDGMVTGDPLVGRRDEDRAQLARRRFTGFVMEVGRSSD